MYCKVQGMDYFTVFVEFLYYFSPNGRIIACMGQNKRQGIVFLCIHSSILEWMFVCVCTIQAVSQSVSCH